MNPIVNVTVPNSIVREVLYFATSPENSHHFNENRTVGTTNRRFCIVNKTDTQFAELIKFFSPIAYNQIGIPEFKEEPLFGNFLGINSAGGNVHEHMDPGDEFGNHHLRLNIMIQKPHGGGMPVIDGIEYKIEEGQAWINYASDWRHGSTKVVGDRDRVVLSMGALVAPEYVRKLSKVIGWDYPEK
jgi:hypothetical protein